MIYLKGYWYSKTCCCLVISCERKKEILGIEPWCMWGKYSTTKSHPKPNKKCFWTSQTLYQGSFGTLYGTSPWYMKEIPRHITLFIQLLLYSHILKCQWSHAHLTAVKITARDHNLRWWKMRSVNPRTLSGQFFLRHPCGYVLILTSQVRQPAPGQGRSWKIAVSLQGCWYTPTLQVRK